MYKYYISYNQYSNALTHYTTFLFEAEYYICLLCACVFNYVEYLMWAALDTVSVFNYVEYLMWAALDTVSVFNYVEYLMWAALDTVSV